jgi:hypothetical protein
MPGRKPLQRLQFGRETTPGTAVAATARMRWNGGMLQDTRALEFPEEVVGLFDATDRSVITMIDAALDVADTPITPEQLPYLLVMLFGGPFAGAADGAGSTGFRYVTNVPTTTAPTNTAFTVEGGDDFEVERMAYAKAIKVVLKGSAGKVNTMSASLIGQGSGRFGSGFSSTTISDVNDLIFGNSRLYLDAIGSVGTTLITNQFLGFELTFEAMWEKKFTGEANTTSGPIWTFAQFVDKKITGKITLEHDTAVDGNTGAKAQFRAQTPRALQIDMLGQAYATPGSGTLLTGRRGVRVALPIKWTKPGALEDQNKNDIITMEFASKYNSTFGSAGSITVCNEVSTLP